jgi:hypothetical protein
MVGRFLQHAAIFVTLFLGLGKVYGALPAVFAWTRTHPFLTTILLFGAAIWWFVLDEWKVSETAAKFDERRGDADEEDDGR